MVYYANKNICQVCYNLLALLLDEEDFDLVVISDLTFGTSLLFDFDLVLCRVILSEFRPFLFTPSNLVYSNRGPLIEELSFSIWSTFLVSCIFCWTGLIGWKCPTSSRVWEKYKSFIGSQSKEIELFVKSRTKSRFKLGLLSTFEP